MASVLQWPQPDSAATTIVNQHGGDSSSNEGVEAPNPNRPFPKEEVHKLARSYSRHSTHSRAAAVPGDNPFEADEDSALNPSSPNFNARKWI